MKIAVLSDTHIPIAAPDLPKAVYDGIKDADLILHAGDIVDRGLLNNLSKIAPVKAVCGNMDSSQTCADLPKKDIVETGGVRIGLIHGWGAPSGLIDIVGREFKDSRINAIVFGHSHQPLIKEKDGILFFNPGSPTDKIFAPYNSYGILEIEAGRIVPTIVRL